MMINNRKYRMRSLNSVVFDKVVGSGTFGVVFKAIDKQTNERVALKKIKMEKESNGFPITALREIKILRALNHDNIIHLKEMLVYDSQKDTEITVEQAQASGLVDGDIFMVFEFCNFDLSGLLRSNRIELTDYHVKSYMKQLLHGVAYMHTNKILHRDIKGANILITRGNVLKIADWGLARSYQPTANNQPNSNQELTNPVVTQWYRSPELLLGSKKYGSEVDMWSIGCLFAEMKSKPHAPVFPGKDEVHQLELIFQLLGSATSELDVVFKQLPAFERATNPTAADNNNNNNSSSNNNGNGNNTNNPNNNTPTSNNNNNNLLNIMNRTYTSRFHRRFGTVMDQYSLQLLGQLLDLDPKKRISAALALNSDYFWIDPAPHPQELPTFDHVVEGAFALSEDERMREEHNKRKEDELQRLQQLLQVKQEQLQQQQQQQQQQLSQGSGGSGRGGGGGRGMHNNNNNGSGSLSGGRGRFNQTSKYSVSKPSATTTTTTTAASSTSTTAASTTAATTTTTTTTNNPNTLQSNKSSNSGQP